MFSLRVTAYDQSLLLARLQTLENMVLTEIHFKEPIKEICAGNGTLHRVSVP